MFVAGLSETCVFGVVLIIYCLFVVVGGGVVVVVVSHHDWNWKVWCGRAWRIADLKRCSRSNLGARRILAVASHRDHGGKDNDNKGVAGERG